MSDIKSKHYRGLWQRTHASSAQLQSLSQSSLTTLAKDKSLTADTGQTSTQEGCHWYLIPHEDREISMCLQKEHELDPVFQRILIFSEFTFILVFGVSLRKQEGQTVHIAQIFSRSLLTSLVHYTTLVSETTS